MSELIPGLSAVGEVDRLGILIVGERAVRGFGLHRVAEGLQAGLSHEEESSRASKARQDTFHKQLGRRRCLIFEHASNDAQGPRRVNPLRGGMARGQLDLHRFHFEAKDVRPNIPHAQGDCVHRIYIH